MPTTISLLPLLALLAPLTSAQYTATYSPSNLPDTSQTGQSGTNACGTASNQTSECQNLYINSVDDFCVWGPPSGKSDEGDGTAKIGNVEQIVVSYCLNDGYGTRFIPAGTITGAHFVKVVSDEVSYVQVTGSGDFTKILIPADDEGGELDPHSWTGLGNPQGGLVFTNAFDGSYEQTHEWTSFMGANEFCVRACQDGPNAAGWCQHIYDTLDCSFTIPGSQDAGFDTCLGDPALEPGVYSGSTFSQGQASTPAAHPPGSTSACTTVSTIGGSSANLAAATVASNSSAANATAAATTTGNGTAAATTTSKSTSKITTTSMVTSMSAKASASAAVAAAAATSGATSAGERVVGSVGAVVGGLMAVAVTVF